MGTVYKPLQATQAQKTSKPSTKYAKSRYNANKAVKTLCKSIRKNNQSQTPRKTHLTTVKGDDKPEADRKTSRKQSKQRACTHYIEG